MYTYLMEDQQLLWSFFLFQTSGNTLLRFRWLFKSMKIWQDKRIKLVANQEEKSSRSLMNYLKDCSQLNHPLYIFKRSTCTRLLRDTATLAAEHNGGNDGNWNGGAHVKFNISFQLEVLGLGGRSVSGSDYSYLTCSYYNSSLHFCELLGFGKERQMELQSPINFHSQQNKYWCDYILSKAISSRFPHI